MAATPDTLTVTLLKQGIEWTRKFSPQINNTECGRALNELGTRHFDKLYDAFKGIHDEKDLKDILNPTSGYFTDYNGMAWYLDLVGEHLSNHHRGKYEMRVKACDQHLYVRLFDCDTKKLVLRPFFYSARPAVNKSDRERKRGFADIILLLAPELKDQIESENLDGLAIKDRFYWAEIIITGEVHQEQHANDGTLEIKLERKVNLFKRELDEEKKVIAIRLPGKAEDTKVLVVSRNTREAICELSQVWHNKSARSVLLCAATGSGKEVLKDMLLYSYSVEAAKIIQEAAPVIAGNKEPLTVLLKALRQESLVAGDELKTPAILFLDEIHHPQVKNLRTILLRCMEDERLHIPGEISVKAKGLLYVFAASKPRAVLRDLPPPDFWTRIEHTVVMKHALLDLSRHEKKEVLQQFFCFFWRKVSKDWPHPSSHIHEELVDTYQNIEDIAVKFANELSSPLIPVVSVRMIRSLIYRLYSKAVYFAGTEQVNRKDLATRIVQEFDIWIADLWDDIVPEARTEMF